MAGDALENQSNSSMAQASALNTLFGLGPLHHLKHSELIQSLGSEEILATTRKYFGQDPTIVTVSPHSGPE